jgi:hypothetical protein
MRVISKTGASGVEYPPSSGNRYVPGPDGVFEMPEHVARELAKKHASQWSLESMHAGTQQRQRSAKLRNPRVAADTISRLLDDVESLKARVADLESLVEDVPADGEQGTVMSETQGDSDGDEPGPGGEQGAEADAPPEARPKQSASAAPSPKATARARSTRSGARAKPE